MNCHYALCVTSCDRFDLLRTTLTSFIQTCDINPRVTIILEDGDKDMPAWLREPAFSPLNVRWIKNGQRRGQVFSVDRLISAIPKEIERVFWLEDDWEAVAPGYIKRALQIIDEYPLISQVILRRDWPHPLVQDPNYPFPVAEPYWAQPGGSWGGWTWNPCVTRTETLKRFGTYASQAGYVGGCQHELVFSRKFLDAGYRIASLPHHFEHIGEGRSRATEPLHQQAPKILIAIPASKNCVYGAWESGDSPKFDPANAYNGVCYGQGIHMSGPNPRLKAVRDTWAQDIAPFASHVDLKFFYGSGVPATEPDEVSLPVPDDYEHLPHKTIAICQWARERGYGFVFKCDDDSFVWVDRLIPEIIGFNGDYGGYLNMEHCSGGPGYLLSKRAIDLVANTSPGWSWAEDVTVGHTLIAHDVYAVSLPGHKSGRSDHWFFPNGFDPAKLDGDEVCVHAVQSEVMYACYAHNKKIEGN
jgi:hypothetical protein